MGHTVILQGGCVQRLSAFWKMFCKIWEESLTCEELSVGRSQRVVVVPERRQH
jgi:hypothetical protein